MAGKNGSGKDILAALVKASTQCFRQTEYPEPKALEYKTPEAARIHEFLDTHRDAFDGHRRDVVRMMSAIAGEEIKDPAFSSRRSPEVDLKKWQFAAVVPLRNPNSHNYPLNTVAVVHYGNMAVRGDGSEGNHMTEDRDYLRPATDEEIDAYFEALPADGLKLLKRRGRMLVKMATILKGIEIPEDLEDEEDEED